MSSWTTLSELLFHSWVVPKQNSVEWLPRLENWGWLQRLQHQGPQILFSDLKRISNERIGLSELVKKEKDSKRNPHKTLSFWTPAQRTNLQEGIRQQQSGFFMQYFAKILKREERKKTQKNKMRDMIVKTRPLSRVYQHHVAAGCWFWAPGSLLFNQSMYTQTLQSVLPHKRSDTFSFFPMPLEEQILNVH